MLLVAENYKEIIGFISAQRGQPNRIKHTAYIVVGVRKAFQGKGIGSEFFKRLDLWSRQNSITRLELMVMCHNKIAEFVKGRQDIACIIICEDVAGDHEIMMIYQN